MRIFVATNNAHKVSELKRILNLPGIKIISMKDAGYNSNPDENGETFEDNALIKARALAKIIRKNGVEKFCVIADDSGLCVDYLNGAPGVHSARYVDSRASDHERNISLLKALDGVEYDKRTGKFVCAAVAVYSSGVELITRGQWHGVIATEESGNNGFGYDPIFYIPEIASTAAALTSEEKNLLSHRGIAFKNLANMIMNMK